MTGLYKGFGRCDRAFKVAFRVGLQKFPVKLLRFKMLNVSTCSLGLRALGFEALGFG